MIEEKEEKFEEILEMICVCIKNADYYSAKEIAELELGKLKKEDVKK